MQNKKSFAEEPDCLPLSTPHFDEEWTVLTALPVVPLKDLNAHSGMGRVLKLVGAFVGASLFGVVVALASIRFRGETTAATPAPVSEQETLQSNADPTEQSSILSPTANAAETVPSEDPAPVVVPKTPVKVAVVNKKSTEWSPPETTQQPASLNVIAAEVLSQPRPEDKWQEQRPRRVNRRPRSERTDPQANRNRGLLGINEIFEGTNQQQRPDH